MMKMRGTLLPVAISGLVGLSLAGCSGDDKGSGGSSAKPASAIAQAVLTGSTSGVAKGDYALTVKAPDGTQLLVIDAETKSGSVKANYESEGSPFTYDVVFLGNDRWMKMTVPGAPDPYDGKSWMHFDGSKVKGDAAKDLSIDTSHPDVLRLTELIAAATTVKGDATAVSGTIDGTKIAGDDGVISAADLKDAGQAATAIPFTAAMDGTGLLESLELDMPATVDTEAGKWSFELSGYGEQTQQEKPTGAIKEMPASAYEMLNG
ncbi:hypothetical protein HH310_04260 [Actinoplanes sp. TBRC 11911]|uniref:hypothetical protein n=1 Tax=Actinoplanes sp. TBRC 11911 TaxID=2729386 RepID=UPI00145DE3CD|nr:hypothetical protein [Actinoplanes sp. TBRC 11911]NMO50405.1 hypothetical protein [Actinoplanes sp. TBRC 11911]